MWGTHSMERYFPQQLFLLFRKEVYDGHGKYFETGGVQCEN